MSEQEGNSSNVGAAVIGAFAAVAFIGIVVANSPIAADPDLKKAETNQTFRDDIDRDYHEFASNDEINGDSWTAMGSRVLENYSTEFLQTLDNGNYWIVLQSDIIGDDLEVSHVSVGGDNVNMITAYNIEDENEGLFKEVLHDIKMSGVANRGFNLVIKETDQTADSIGLSQIRDTCSMRFIRDGNNKLVKCEGEVSPDTQPIALP